MVTTWVIFFMLPILVSCSGDGNIHLMEEDVAAAINSCNHIYDKEYSKDSGKRQRRFDTDSYNNQIPRIDANTNEDVNPYVHTRRNSNTFSQMHVFNGSDNNYTGYGAGNVGEKFVNSIPRPAIRKYKNNGNHSNAQNDRVKRNEMLINKNDNDQCLSQCVFANLQMVDSKGIPREAEMWNKVQTSVTSQQSRVILQNQIRACFQELQSESEENGCSYSNKLERCLMLRFADRKVNATLNQQSATNSSFNRK
ncbi:uncharacterized protein LOC124537514 [Vanessa cardui]|uniref:uncharacterized protein LOC124537514 n=1 Tax=Vanessa cardui TaxID=171605 RepID=UPI001F12EBB5|nr:uncharacterized protein LOC124537514 [Vanessa cardui]